MLSGISPALRWGGLRGGPCRVRAACGVPRRERGGHVAPGGWRHDGGHVRPPPGVLVQRPGLRYGRGRGALLLGGRRGRGVAGAVGPRRGRARRHPPRACRIGSTRRRPFPWAWTRCCRARPWWSPSRRCAAGPRRRPGPRHAGLRVGADGPAPRWFPGRAERSGLFVTPRGGHRGGRLPGHPRPVRQHGRFSARRARGLRRRSGRTTYRGGPPSEAFSPRPRRATCVAPRRATEAEINDHSQRRASNRRLGSPHRPWEPRVGCPGPPAGRQRSRV